MLNYLILYNNILFYPLGLLDDKIHPFSKIVTYPIVYDVMTTIRCYHSACKPFNALSVMKEIDEDLDDK